LDSNRIRPQSHKEPDTGLSSAPHESVPDSNNKEEPDPAMQGTDDFSYISKIAKEGGTDFMRWLLTKAVIPSSAKEQTPIQFRDIVRLPKQQQLEWKQACREELEALHKRHVYELVDLPPGRKAIKNRWVFSINIRWKKTCQTCGQRLFTSRRC
jgi:hypothetical protein